MDTLTPDEQLDKHYAACLDSVAVVNALAESNDVNDQATVTRNIEHLKLMLNREAWKTRHDLTPITDAIALAE